MRWLEIGDPVRIDIPDETDPDHDQYHGATGEIIGTIDDDAGIETGDERDSQLYRVELSNGSVRDFRWRDLRPAHDG